ncbi:MAG: hypothetical protein WB755_08505, partial [Terriglobales bacterium]
GASLKGRSFYASPELREWTGPPGWFWTSGRQTLPWDYFPLARNPPRIQAKGRDHFLLADLSIPIHIRHRITSG